MKKLCFISILIFNNLLFTYAQTVTDIDGNVYNTVQIGNQIWMKENLKTTHYSDGTPLVDGTGAGGITEDYTTKYYFWYNDDPSNGDTYGALYTWAAIMNGASSSNSNPSEVQGICPTGWHIPSDDEWKELEIYLGMSQMDADAEGWRGTDEGGKLKETGISHWSSPNTGATDESGFTALPSGYRDSFGGFAGLGNETGFWSSTEYDSTAVRDRLLNNNKSQIFRWGCYKAHGAPLRCVQDSSSGIEETSIEKILIYPNPTKEIVYIRTKNINNSIIQITNINGQVISSKELNTKSTPIDLSNILNGVYFIKIISNEFIKTVKLIKY